MRKDEVPLLEEFLYQAIYVPADFQGDLSRGIIWDDPRLAAAVEGFGTLPDDKAVVAEVAGVVVGSCWARITNGYGHIDEATPSLSISLLEDFRGQGLGTELLQHMIDELFRAGYARVSLSVQKENPALHLYRRMGFLIVGNGADDTEWLMVRGLNELFTVIETERLVLRPWLSSDAEALFALASDPDVGPAAGWPAHGSQDMSAEIIRTVLAAPETYAVVLKSTGDVVGCTGMLFGDDANVPLGGNEAELGYWLGKPSWGFGYATEAARAVVERGFSHLGLHAVWTGYYDGNDRSRRVLDKIGFNHVCTVRDVPCDLLDDIRTEHHMRLLRRDDRGSVRSA